MVRVQFSPATKGTYSKEVKVPAAQFGLPPDNPPTIVDQDNITLYKFTVDTDRMFYLLDIAEDYASGDIGIIIMWTNDGGADDNGKNVKWQIDYQVSGAGDPVSGSHAGPKSVEDAYASDSGWIEHHTAAMAIAAADFSGKHHILLKLSAVEAPAVVLTCEPHLICMCYYYTAKWGKKP